MNWSMLQSYSLVMLGGAFGSGLRLWLSSLIASRYGETFPWGTFVVNVVGCLVIGFYVALTGPQGVLFASPLARQFATIGVLGGFTTFSSFGLQTYNLLTNGEWFRAALNAFGSLFTCILAVWVGTVLASAINQR
jgi:fluoride exporter